MNNSESEVILIEKYLNSLSEQEKQALEIAKEQLESSFSLEKSIGFLNFKKQEEKNYTNDGVHQS